MPRNNLHSFTLKYESSKIVRREPRGRKARMVSDAIFRYDLVGIRTLPCKEERLRELVESRDELIERHRKSQLLIKELEKNQSFISKMRKKWSK